MSKYEKVPDPQMFYFFDNSKRFSFNNENIKPSYAT